jgi:hypothetical protein
MTPGDGVDRHKADVVTIAGVCAAGIAEPDEEQHEENPCKRKWPGEPGH